MQLNKLIVISAIFALCTGGSANFAQASLFRVGFLTGVGVSVSVDQSSFVEAPLGTDFFFDYTLNANWVVGLEHMRTWNISPFGSANSFTLMTFRYYFLSEVPLGGTESDLASMGSFIVNDDFGFYIAGSVGTGQSSVSADQATNNASVVGFAAAVKGGVDYNFFEKVGLRAEGGITNKIGGQGELVGIFLLFGVYLNI